MGVKPYLYLGQCITVQHNNTLQKPVQKSLFHLVNAMQKTMYQKNLDMTDYLVIPNDIKDTNVVVCEYLQFLTDSSKQMKLINKSNIKINYQSLQI